MFLMGKLVLCCCIFLLSFLRIRADKPRPLLLLSFDGFRYDYVTRYNAKAFKQLAEKGASAANGYFPAYPSSTFPCHYTLVTGLYPESHGIVYNRMYDPLLNEIFTLANTDTKWFEGGEPIWITARLNNLKSACYFWPGSETVIRNTTANMYKHYDRSVPFKERINGVVDWLSNEDVSFATLYFEQPDSAGHQFGPFSPEVEKMVQTMDDILQYLVDKLAEEKLTEKVNLIVTSDHGMTDLKHDDEHILYLSRILNPTDYALVAQYGTLAGIWPKPNDKEKLYQKLVEKLNHPNITAYRKEDIPEQFHYSNNRRIMPIVLIADEGYAILENENQLSSYAVGQHGYDNHLESMRPVFIASGPDFVQNVEGQPFDSVNIYPLMCHLLGIEPRPNNGSLDNVRWMLADNTNAAITTKIDMVVIPTLLLAICLLKM